MIERIGEWLSGADLPEWEDANGRASALAVRYASALAALLVVPLCLLLLRS